MKHTSFNQWSTLTTEKIATPNLEWQFWADVRQYLVQHTMIEKTRYTTTENNFSYGLALASHMANKSSHIELLKHSFKINNQAPETPIEQIIIAIQEALFPYIFKIDNKTGKLQNLINFKDIKDEWNANTNTIKEQYKNESIERFAAKMGANLTNKDAFEACIKKELLLQILFFPFYGASFNLGNPKQFKMVLTHPVIDIQEFDGELTITKDDEASIYTISFKAHLLLNTIEQKEVINKILAQHYQMDLINEIEANSTIAINLYLNSNNEQVVNASANIETKAGDYFYQQEKLSVSFTNDISPVFDAENDYLKTLFLQSQTEIII